MGKYSNAKRKYKSEWETEEPFKEYGPIDVSSEEKEHDLILALHITNHTLIRTIDHLGEILNKHFCKGDAHDSKSQVRLHGTKCASIITDVLKQLLTDQFKIKSTIHILHCL